MIPSKKQVPTETALLVLAREQRRSILTVLISRDENVVTVDELVKHLDQESPNEETADPSRLGIRLMHVHLPKLEDADIVEYDESRNRVRYHPDARVEKLHQFVTEELE